MKSAGGCITCEDAWLFLCHGRILYAIVRIAIMVVRGGTGMKYLMIVLLLMVANASAAPPKFELVDGDRVVFIGNTFVERDIQHNYLETMLSMGWRDRNYT